MIKRAEHTLIERLIKHAAAGEIKAVPCKDSATGTEVDVLCIKNANGSLEPIGKLFASVAEANFEVTPQGGYHASKNSTLH